MIDEQLIVRISKLPKEIQKKIYINTWRLFWRDYTPLTAKIPTWYNYKILIEQIIFQSRVKNIHFLHLPFNTLPENKKWIMGCQCDYCLNEPMNYDKYRLYLSEHLYSKKFKEIMPNSDLYLNDIHNPLCGSDFEDIIAHALRTNEIQLEF